jgi:hypothetical protein
MKQKALKLSLKKTNIVNLHTLSQIYGGTNSALQTNVNDPAATCGVCATQTSETKDRTNTNNDVPTISGN